MIRNTFYNPDPSAYIKQAQFNYIPTPKKNCITQNGNVGVQCIVKQLIHKRKETQPISTHATISKINKKWNTIHE